MESKFKSTLFWLDAKKASVIFGRQAWPIVSFKYNHNCDLLYFIQIFNRNFRFYKKLYG